MPKSRAHYAELNASILSQHFISCYRIFTVNLCCRSTSNQGPFFSAYINIKKSVFPIGGQTPFICCPLKYIYSVSINLNLQHSDVSHCETAALSQPRGLRRTGILHIGCDIAHDWLHVCFLTANILSDCKAGSVCPPHACSPLSTEACEWERDGGVGVWVWGDVVF